MRTIATPLFLASALLGCCAGRCVPCEPVFAEAAPSERPVAAPRPVEDPADAVYDAFIRSFLDGETAKAEHPVGPLTELVFERMTAHADEPILDGHFQGWDSLHGQLKDLRRETFDAFAHENAGDRDLRGRVRFEGHIEFLTKEQDDKLFEGDPDAGWKRFRQQHPGAAGILSLSNVGISHDGRQALLYVAFVGGGEDGWGQYFLYARSSGSWKVVATLTNWVS